jgi:chemotaxis protein histidine kinase CheA
MVSPPPKPVDTAKPDAGQLQWYQSLGFSALAGLVLMSLWIVVGIVLVMQTKGRDLVLKESERLIEQTGNNAVAELATRLSEIGALARTLSETAKILPKNDAAYKDALPPLVNFQNDQAVAGGGYWPEPFLFNAEKARNSFFWGRGKDGALEYFDGYNDPSGAGYHNEEWYVVVKHSRRGRCFWSRSYVDPYSFQPMTTCTVGIFEGNKFTGEVTIDVKLEGLGAMASAWRKKTGGYVFILDRNNKFLTFPDPKPVKKIGRDDKGNKTEDFLFANDLAAVQPQFAPIAKTAEELNQNILAAGKVGNAVYERVATAIDNDSYQIDRTEAEFVAAVIPDPLDGQTQQTKLLKTISLDQDFVTGEAATAFFFHVPSAYWKVVVVKPVSEAGVVASSITWLLIAYLTVTVFVVMGFAYFGMRRFIVSPLQQTTAAVQLVGQRVANEDFANLDQLLPKGRPSNEIGLLSNVFEDLTQRVAQSHKSLAESSARLKSLNEDLEKVVNERTQKLQAILNNVQNGFFLVDTHYKVQEGYTRSCEALFGGRISAGMPVTQLMRLEGDEEKGYKQLLEQVFEDLLPEEMMLAQMSKRALLGNRHLDLEARVVRDHDGVVQLVMFTVTDVTALVQAERQNERISSLNRILSQKEAFALFVRGCHVALAEAEVAITSRDQATARARLASIRENSSSFGLGDLAGLIQRIEGGRVITTAHLSEVESALSGFLSTHFDVLGAVTESASELIAISERQLADLRAALGASRSLDGAREQLESWVEGVVHRPIGELVAPLIPSVPRAAEHLGKRATLHLEADDIRVDPREVAPIIQSLRSLVRSALDSGIERREERGPKPEQAMLNLIISDAHSEILIRLSDDGRGIDASALATRAMQKGIVTPEQLSRMSHPEILNLVFVDGMSGDPTDRSVPSVDMAAIARSVRQCEGSIELSSVPGGGTTVVIRLPHPMNGRRPTPARSPSRTRA